MMLENKIIVITGAAGGIGLAAARRFTEEGAFVIGLDVNEALCVKAEKELSESGYKTLFIPCDISCEENVNAAFDKIAATVDHIDGLYNNASIFLGRGDGPIGDIDPAVWSKVLGRVALLMQ